MFGLLLPLFPSLGAGGAPPPAPHCSRCQYIVYVSAFLLHMLGLPPVWRAGATQ